MNRSERPLVMTGLLSLATLAGCQVWEGMSPGMKGAATGVGGAGIGYATSRLLGAGETESLAIGALAGLLVGGATYLGSREASAEERRRAEQEAAEARLRLQDEEIRRLQEEQAVLAVRVDGPAEDVRETTEDATTMDVMYVDPATGVPVSDDVHTIEGMEPGTTQTIGDRTVVFLG